MPVNPVVEGLVQKLLAVVRQESDESVRLAAIAMLAAIGCATDSVDACIEHHFNQVMLMSYGSLDESAAKAKATLTH